MAITPEKTESKTKELLPEGNHVARLYKIILLGTIPVEFNGETKQQTKVRLTFEFPTEMRKFGDDEEEKPMVRDREMTLSLYRGESMTAVLRRVAEALIGEGLTDEEAESFDVEELLGKACMIQVIHSEFNGNKYAKLDTFSSIPKGMEVPAQINDSVVQNVREMTTEEIDELPEFLAEKMKSSNEYHVRFEAPRDEDTTPSNQVGDGPSSDADHQLNKEDIPF